MARKEVQNGLVERAKAEAVKAAESKAEMSCVAVAQDW